MEGLNRVEYDKINVTDMETDVGYTVKQSISQGINDGGVLCFRLLADPERFTDLNTLLLRLEVGLENADGTAVDAAKIVCLEQGGMHSLFSSCEVRFNEEVVSTMTAYPFTTALCRYLGVAKEIRDGVMDTLDGTYNSTNDSSDVDSSDPGKVVHKKRKDRVNTDAVLIGRIYSDVLTSSRQYLPPGVTLGIDLRRAHDSFSLISTETGANFKVVLKTASIYARRLKLRPSLVPRAIESAKSGGGINFNRLETRLMAISRGVTVFRWLDCLNSAPLPNRIYVGFIAQSSLYGSYAKMSTHFETLNLSSLNFKLNGRDLLVEPIHVAYPRKITGKLNMEGVDGMEGFLTIAEVLNVVSDQTQSLRLNYASYLQGMTVYAVELGKVGEKSGSSGCLDLELLFAANGAERDACVMIFTEKSDLAPIRPRAI